jgi:hypothetical protein
MGHPPDKTGLPAGGFTVEISPKRLFAASLNALIFMANDYKSF